LLRFQRREAFIEGGACIFYYFELGCLKEGRSAAGKLFIRQVVFRRLLRFQREAFIEGGTCIFYHFELGCLKEERSAAGKLFIRHVK